MHTQPYEVDWGGDAQSPFIVKKKWIVLFVSRAMTKYIETPVYWSRALMNFPKVTFVTELQTHAA